MEGTRRTGGWYPRNTLKDGEGRPFKNTQLRGLATLGKDKEFTFPARPPGPPEKTLLFETPNRHPHRAARSPKSARRRSEGHPSPHPHLPAASGPRRAPLGLLAGLSLPHNKSRYPTAQRQSAYHAAALRAHAHWAEGPRRVRTRTRPRGEGRRARARTLPGKAARRATVRTHARMTHARGPGRGPGRGAQAAAEAAGRRPLGPCPAGTFIHL